MLTSYLLTICASNLSTSVNLKWRRIKLVQRVLINATIKSKNNGAVFKDLVLGEFVQYNLVHYNNEVVPY